MIVINNKITNNHMLKQLVATAYGKCHSVQLKN